jgi:ubiquinone/menaquinone biosynthesis C-methylase UbiE
VVLEIGAGSGLNLSHYAPPAARVIAVEPSPGLARVAASRRAAARVRVDWVRGAGEALPLAEGSVDTVVLTWTLCSVADPARSLAEARRVLKSAGRLLFVEHGRAPDAAVLRWQQRITPHWRRVSGNCHLDRPIEALIRSAGFTLTELDAEYIGMMPKAMTYFYRGIASPAVVAPASS